MRGTGKTKRKHRSSCRSNNRSNNRSTTESDVTINEFADSAEPRTRSRKLPPVPPIASALPDDETPPTSPPSSPLPIREAPPPPPTGEYPEILFYLISQHIDPEDVGRFARVNRCAHSQTKRAEFWTWLWRRHCARALHRLPPALRVDSSDSRLYGLRQKVIRALHHVYPPFVAHGERWKLTDVVGWYCVEVWDRRRADADGWLYCWKLRRSARRAPASTPAPAPAPALANSQAGYVALLVVCGKQQGMPPCWGMRVTEARVSAESTAALQRTLHLQMASVSTLAKPLPVHTALSLYDVKSVEVVDWWHRRYPAFECRPPPPAPPPPGPLYDDFFSLPLS